MGLILASSRSNGTQNYAGYNDYVDIHHLSFSSRQNSAKSQLHQSLGNLVHGMHRFHLWVTCGVRFRQHDLEAKEECWTEEGELIACGWWFGLPRIFVRFLNHFKYKSVEADFESVFWNSWNFKRFDGYGSTKEASTFSLRTDQSWQSFRAKNKEISNLNESRLQVNASNILIHTLTPRPMRKELSGSANTSPSALHKSHSCSSIKDHEKEKSPMPNRKFKFDNNLTVHVRKLFGPQGIIFNQSRPSEFRIHSNNYDWKCWRLQAISSALF